MSDPNVLVFREEQAKRKQRERDSAAPPLRLHSSGHRTGWDGEKPDPGWESHDTLGPGGKDAPTNIRRHWGKVGWFALLTIKRELGLSDRQLCDLLGVGDRVWRKWKEAQSIPAAGIEQRLRAIWTLAHPHHAPRTEGSTLCSGGKTCLRSVLMDL